MASWLRWDDDSDWHPQVRRAGFAGARVFEVLCRTATQHGREVLGPADLDPDYLCDRLGRGCPRDLVVQGLADALAAGLIVRTTDGGVAIPGLPRLQGRRQGKPSDDPARVRDRVQRHRAARRDQPAPVDAVTPPVTPPSNAPVTPRRVTADQRELPTTGNDRRNAPVTPATPPTIRHDTGSPPSVAPATRARRVPTDRDEAIGGFRRAWEAAYQERAILDGPKVSALEAAWRSWCQAGDTASFCATACPAYLADRDRFLVEARHHPRHMQARLDRYRVAAPGAQVGGCCYCHKRLDDGRSTTTTNEGRAHSDCAEAARRRVTA